jgi:PAS domain S-box-containing protein
MQAYILVTRVKLGSIFEQIAEACLVLDSSARVIFMNDSAARLLGRPAKEFYGQPLPEDAAAGLPLKQMCDTVASTRQPARLLRKITTAGGLERWFELRASPGADAVVLFCFEAASAPSESTAALEQRIQRYASEVAEATRELESVSYTVSHDLRAPLRHIEAFAGLLEQNLAGKTDASTGEYLSIISESAKQMSELLDGVLAYSRLCRREVNRATVSIDAALKAVLHDLKMQIECRQIEWRIDPLPEVQADPWMVRQCLGHLISNALKFTRTRPVTSIHVSSVTTPEQTIIRVQDNGVGFDLEYSERLFGLFQKLHSDPQYEGAGVGLAHVRRMMQRQGGRIWAEAKPGSGATFFIAFPKFETAPR